MISGIYYPDETEGEYCIACNMGIFDICVLQSDYMPLLEFCLNTIQNYFDHPLTIVRLEEIREIDFQFKTMDIPLLCVTPKNGGDV